MKKIMLYTLLALTITACKGENNSVELDEKTENAKSTAYKKFDHFILNGYQILDTLFVDFNDDGNKDCFLALKKINEEQSSDITEHPEFRPLLILEGSKKNLFQLIQRNDKIIYCVDGGGVLGDPYGQMIFEDGNLSIEMNGGSSMRWTRTLTFKMKSDTWYLYKDELDSYSAFDPMNSVITTKTSKDFGDINFEDFDAYKN